ncbi:MAG: hypothetical protein IJA91_05920, partial [Clostridia bacterium]|nr:hypothetical protein [Clostridia bacterium]
MNMNVVKFSAAKAVFVPFSAPAENAVNQYGFYSALDLSDYASDSENPTGDLTLDRVVIRLTARNVYRLYINGKIVMHGPARTAHEYCRIDEIDITDRLIDGVNHIAVEVVEYGNRCDGYNRYSNDSTMEDGLFIAEIDADGQILTATGRDEWQVCRIYAREPRSERISHSRACTEIYTLDDAYYLWKLGLDDFVPAILLEQEPVYLAHEALMSSLEDSSFDHLLDYGACRMDSEKRLTALFYEVNSPYYESLPEHPTADCRRTVESDLGRVHAEYGEDGVCFDPAYTDDFYALWDGGESRVGFIRLAVTCEQAGVIDLVHSELLSTDGTIPYYHNIVTRLHVPAGLTEFVTMEPALARYVMVYFRGVGAVTVHNLSILDDAYPDECRTSFLCSDENVNRLYQAAKKTLLLNTRDIFMDCPERERGGWLCDSLWTARAAALMLSDSRVEREFLENFLLTPADGMFHGFFPEVYPALKPSYKDMTGITTWSFWLMCEVCEFIRRTGDITFRKQHKPRISAFVAGTKDFLGSSGLLENLPWLFVDWSMSNYGEYQHPVSTPANALYAYMMTELGETFGQPDWVAEGQRVRSLLRKAIIGNGDATDVKYIPDSFNIDENGTLHSRDRYSEAAMYTALWSGLFTVEEAPQLVKAVRDKMGPAPLYAKDPTVGGSQLFIGLCIRLDMLSRQGYYNKMYEDMRAIFDPQLKEGPGTLWENEAIDTSSRCHGFTAHVGVHLIRDVLGLGIPVFDQKGDGARSLTIAPHICGLRWAKGTHETPDGIISVSWRYDGESFTLKISLPADMDYQIELP